MIDEILLLFFIVVFVVVVVIVVVDPRNKPLEFVQNLVTNR